ncbi:MAG: DUF1492 domain-containing protein [Lachnospiraceae bacterium]|nr:DUF1492 domain-containing protein [Lachnospiraceae bacterium]
MKWQYQRKKGEQMGKTDNENKKKYLQGYRASVRRIGRIKAEIDEIRELKTSISSSASGGYRRSWKGDLSGYAAKLDGMQRQLEAERQARIRLHDEITRAINSVPDSQEQDVLFYRYISGLRWWEIAERMQCSERWVLKLHGDALEHLKIFEKNSSSS